MDSEPFHSDVEKMKLKTIETFLIAAGVIAAAASCDKNTLPGGTAISTPIGISVSTAGTRGSALTTENIATSCGEFVCDIWLNSDKYEELSGYMPTITPGSQHYVDKATVKYTDGQWKFDSEKQPTWVHNIQSQFWAWAPKEVSSRSIAVPPTANAEKITINYGLPMPNGTTDATRQQDLIFAYAEKTFNAEATTPDATIDLEFKHALAEIRFMVEAGSASDIDITSVKFEGVKATGILGFYKDGSFSCFTAGPDYTVGQSSPFTGAVAGTAAGKSVFVTTNNFFMIPQDLQATTKVTITLANGSELSANIKDIQESWESGKYYTYLLSKSSNSMKLNVTLVDWEDGNDPDNPDDTTIQYPVLS